MMVKIKLEQIKAKTYIEFDLEFANKKFSITQWELRAINAKDTTPQVKPNLEFDGYDLAIFADFHIVSFFRFDSEVEALQFYDELLEFCDRYRETNV